jgi:hypothetical protein
MVEPYDEPSSSHANQLILVRPRDSDEDLREYTPLARRSGEVTRRTELIADGDYEEVIETKKDRRGRLFLLRRKR